MHVVDKKENLGKRTLFKLKALSASTILASFGAIAATEPASHMFDNGISATPTLTLGLSHDDNVSSQSNADAKISSFVYTVQPSVNFAGEVRNHLFYTTVGAALGKYASSSEDDYLNYYALAGAKFAFDLRHNLELDAGYAREHESRGEGISEGFGSVLTRPIELYRETIDAEYIYGSEGAKGRLTLGAGYEDATYMNYRDLTGINASRSTRFKDFDVLSLSGEILVRTNRAFDTTIEVTNTKTRYPFSNSQDNRLTLYYIGANWDVTGKTSGFAKVGMQDKKFKNSAGDFNGVSWNIGFTWNPTDYASIGLNTTRIAEDPLAVSGYNDTTKYGLYWQHAWLDRLSTRLSYSHNNEDYNGGSRLDKTDTYGISASYDFRRWLSLSIGVETTDKNSTEADVSFDQTLWYSALTMSL